MKLRRLLSLTCSMAAAVALTACGGGGEKGPAWAEGVKTTLTTTPLTALPPGEYRGSCEIQLAGSDPAAIVVLTISQKGEDIYLSYREDLYDNSSCSDDAFLGSVTQPIARLSLDSEGVDAASGQTFVKVNSSTAGGDVTFTVAPGAPLEFSDASSSLKNVLYKTHNLTGQYVSKVGAVVGKDVYAYINGSLYRGNDVTRTPTASDFATALKLSAPFKPFKLFDVAPGTYARQCVPQDLGTGKLYGFMVKNQFLSRGEDYRPRFIPTLEFYGDDDCETDLLYTVTFPTVFVDTLGNGQVNISGDPAQPLFVDARLISLSNPAGAPVITLDPAAQAAGLVSLTADADGLTVTFLQDQNRQQQYENREAETTAELGYVTGSTLYFGDPSTVDPDISPFPLELFLEVPYTLLPSTPPAP